MSKPILGRHKDAERRFALIHHSAAEDIKIAAGLPLQISYGMIMGLRPDQGNFGCCVAEAATALMQAESIKHNFGGALAMSVSATYAQALRDTGEPDQPITDSGLSTGAGLACYQKHGYVLNKVRPFPTGTNTAQLLAPVPSAEWITSFEEHTYAAVNPDPESIWRALYTRGPIQIGMEWAEEWFTPDPDGVLPPPWTDANGGHSVVICGIDMAKGWLEIANSWGTTWGVRLPDAETGGYCYLPTAFYSDDNFSPYWPTDLYCVSMK